MKLIPLFKLTASVLFIALISVTALAQAQKLSSTQEGSVLAPEKVKIDGKFAEWNDDLKAFNKTTNLYYTLSNDDKNLYLFVKCTDNINNTKILGGGVTLTVNTADKKKDENAFSVTFPIVNRANLRGIRRPRGAGQNTVQDSASLADAAAARKAVIASIKQISVLGFKDITDTLISIYNEYGIKAAANYDEQNNLLFELSIPLKLMNLSSANPKEFAYNIKVNGIQAGNNNNRDRSNGNRDVVRVQGEGGGGNGGGGFGGGTRGGGGGGNRGGGAPGGPGGFGGPNGMEELLSPTDFWAKYTLAKK